MASIKFKNGNSWERVKLLDTSSTNAQDLKADEICKYYAINSSGNHVNSTSIHYGCTSYIDCHSVQQLELTMIQETSASGFGLAFYNQNKEFISFIPNPVGAELASVSQVVSVPANAYYFRTTFFEYEYQKTYGYFSCHIQYVEETIINGKRPYQSGVISFSPAVEQGIPNYDNQDGTVSMITSNLKETTGNLILPPNYTNNGKPVRLILLAHGLYQFSYYQKMGTSQFAAKAAYLASKGYAVFDCNGARNDDQNKSDSDSGPATAHPFPSCGMRQAIEGYRKCYEYIIEHYNVIPEVNAIGCSAGGMVAANYAKRYSCDTRNLICLCSVVSGKYFLQDNVMAYKRAIMLEYTGSNSYDASKYQGMDPLIDGYTIDSDLYINSYRCPVLIVKTTQDEAALNTQLDAFYNGLLRTNMDVHRRIVTNLTHDNIVRDNTPGIDDTIINWLNMN